MTDLETTAKNAALAEVNKQEGWLKANVKPLIIGFVLGTIVGFLLHGL